MEHHCDHIVCAGFFKTILIMFCASAIIFSILFLSSYDGQKKHHHGDSPINRFTHEQVNTLSSAKDSTLKRAHPPRAREQDHHDRPDRLLGAPRATRASCRA